MASKHSGDAAKAWISAIDALLAALDADDFVARRSLEYRREFFVREIDKLENE